MTETDPNNPFGTPQDPNVDPADLDIDIPVEKVVAPGTYYAQVIDYQAKTAKSGNPMIQWDFKITEGPFAGEEVTAWTVTSGKGMFKLRELGRTLGILENNKIVAKRHEIIGLRLMLEITQGEYDGNPTANVKKFIPHPEGPKSTGPVAVFNSPETDDIPFV